MLKTHTLRGAYRRTQRDVYVPGHDYSSAVFKLPTVPAWILASDNPEYEFRAWAHVQRDMWMQRQIWGEYGAPEEGE